MSVYGLFQPSVLGMESQSHALSAIANNISNVRTGGYKRTDVHFATVLNQTLSSAPGATTANPASGSVQSDLGGVAPKDYARISLPGQILPTDRALDLALTGNGFFTFNDAVDASGQTYFGRDGRLTLRLLDDGGGSEAAYLVDKNGYYAMGWEARSDGTFPASSTAPGAMRVDADFIGVRGEPTTAVAFGANLPASDPIGASRRHVLDVFDSNAALRQVDLAFTRSDRHDWDVAITGAAGDVVTVQPSTTFDVTTIGTQTVTATAATGVITVTDTTSGQPVTGAFANLAVGETVTVPPSSPLAGTYRVAAVAADRSGFTIDPATPLAGDATTTAATTFSGSAPRPQGLTFDANGQLTGPPSYTIGITHADGATSSFSLDTAGMTQLGNAYQLVVASGDGYRAGSLASLSVDADGVVLGNFDNQNTVPLYKLAIGDFTNPDGLEGRNGNVYVESEASGAAILGGAGDDHLGTVLAFAHELSNVDIAAEFGQMIRTQHAYNASALSFRTTDEMTETARDLVR